MGHWKDVEQEVNKPLFAAPSGFNQDDLFKSKQIQLHVLKSKEVPVNRQTNNYEDRGGHQTIHKEVLEVGPETLK